MSEYGEQKKWYVCDGGQGRESPWDGSKDQ